MATLSCPVLVNDTGITQEFFIEYGFRSLYIFIKMQELDVFCSD